MPAAAWLRLRSTLGGGEPAERSFGSGFDGPSLRRLLLAARREAALLRAENGARSLSYRHLRDRDDALTSALQRLTEQTRRLERSNGDLELQKAEQIRLAAEVRQQAVELARTNQYRSDFLANMSHELRTPLNSCILLAKVLAENSTGNLSSEQIRFAETIHASGNTLLSLIDDILDITKLEADKVDLDVRPVLVAPMLDELARMFGPIAQQKQLALRLASGGGEFVTDRRRFEQILRNLLSNALKFTSSGHVSLELVMTPVVVSVTVEDTGMGIADDQLERIFEAFRQVADPTRPLQGTGLGLAIARKLAGLLGGYLSVESRLGEGSTFTLTLPRSVGLFKLSPSIAPPPPPPDEPSPVR